jgi:hypothetical protein
MTDAVDLLLQMIARESDERWRLASPDSEENCAITIHHVGGDAIAAARALLVDCTAAVARSPPRRRAPVSPYHSPDS